MADLGPNYTVEAMRLEMQIKQHRQSISKGRARQDDIELQKELNLADAAIRNADLDEEARKITLNEQALTVQIGNIEKNLAAMAQPAKAPKE